MSLALTWLGHSSVVLDIDGVRILTDPLLRRHNGPLRRRSAPPPRAAWEGPDAVLISHLHHDHAELSSLRLLPGVPILTAQGNADWLHRKGIRGGTGIEEGWAEVRNGVEVCLTRADHHHRPMPHRPNHAHGHLIRSASATVWAAGDTSLYEEMRDIPETLGGPLDLALVPISGWGPKLSGGHMDGAQAARACAWTSARWALPVHWGTLHVPVIGTLPRGWMDRPREIFEETLAREAPDCRLIDLGQGQRWCRPEAG